MDDNKTQSLFLIIISIATLLVAIVGTTFAWFSVKLSDTSDNEEKIITKALLASVVFENGSMIDINTLLINKSINKKFKISQTDSSSTKPIKYNLKLNITSNTINSEEQPSLLLHSLISNGNTNGGTLVKLDSSDVPLTSVVIGSGIIDGYETHEYDYNITLNSVDPLLIQGKQFNAYLSVELLEDNK